MQCVNERLFVDFYARTNTGAAMKNPAKLIADAIDAAMQTADNGKPMTQAELSRRSKVPQPTISRTLSGKSIPEIATLAPLIDVLGKHNVDLARSIEALLPKEDKRRPSSAPLVAKIFALPCKECGHVTHQSLIDLDMNDHIGCPSCGARVRVADYYGNAELAKFIESIGATGFVLRNG